MTRRGAWVIALIWVALVLTLVIRVIREDHECVQRNGRDYCRTVAP